MVSSVDGLLRQKDDSGPPTPCADYAFEDSDITIISSDNVAFRVHRYHLMAASSVFRSMLDSATGGNEIKFTDDSIETSRVIRIFLDFLYTGTLKTRIPGGLAPHVGVMAFMRKYDTAILLRQLEHVFGDLAGDPSYSPLRAFILAANLGKPSICARCIDRSETIMFALPKATAGLNATGMIPGASIFDFTALPLDLMELIPLRYVHAVLRASRKRPGQGPDDGGWDAMAEEFKKIMA